MKIFKITVFVLMAGLSAMTSALSQEYPTKPITIIVPFPPGGATDTIGRIVGDELSVDLGQSVIVENKAGASGAIGAALAARAKPDGYTIMVGSIGVLAINPSLFKDLAYDPVKDFDLLTQAVRYHNVLVVHPSFPANTAQEFLDYVKANPDKVVFASVAGSSDHLTAHVFWQATGTKGKDVTYKGSGPLMTDLLGGHAQASFRNYTDVRQQIAAGKLKLLATTSEMRMPDHPDVPTFVELGIKDGVVYTWQGIAAPEGLPQNIHDRLEKALVDALKKPAVTKKLNALGFDVIANSGKEFTAFQAEEIARWKTVVGQGGITVN
jgi:tripartite-type tricarboxylate transporter receptor subunit TctC